METHFVLIDRGVVYTTERRRRQVFPGCVFWVVFNGVQFYLSRQLTKENHGIVESKKREFCMYFLDSATDCIIACFMRQDSRLSPTSECLEQANYIEIMRACLISLFNVKHGCQSKLSYTSIPSAFSLAKKLNLFAKTPEL